jgi:hypothetical protein
MAIIASITSWNDLDMDWSDPEPTKGKYWECLRLALLERNCAGGITYPGFGGYYDFIREPYWDIDFNDETARQEVAQGLDNFLFKQLLSDNKGFGNWNRKSSGWVDPNSNYLTEIWDAEERENFLIEENIGDKIGDPEILQVQKHSPLENYKDYLNQRYRIINKMYKYFNPFGGCGLLNVDSPFKNQEGIRYSEDRRYYEGSAGGTWAEIIAQVSNPSWTNWNDRGSYGNQFDGPGYFTENDAKLTGQPGGNWFQNEEPKAMQSRLYYEYANPWLYDYKLSIMEQVFAIGSGYAIAIEHGRYYRNKWELHTHYDTIPDYFNILYPSDSAFTHANQFIEPTRSGEWAYECAFILGGIRDFSKQGGFLFKDW